MGNQNNNDIMEQLQQDILDNMFEYRQDIRSGEIFAEMQKAKRKKKRKARIYGQTHNQTSKTDIVLCIGIVIIMTFAVWFNVSHSNNVNSAAVKAATMVINPDSEEDINREELRHIVRTNPVFGVIKATVGVDVEDALDRYLEAIDKVKDISIINELDNN